MGVAAHRLGNLVGLRVTLLAARPDRFSYTRFGGFMEILIFSTQVCAKCGQNLPIKKFSFDWKKYRRKNCRKCRGEHLMPSYTRKRNRQDQWKKYGHKHAGHVHENKPKRKFLLIEQIRKKKAIPCADCGHRYPYYVMDFDHRDPAKKEFNISTFRARNPAALWAEIDKCDVVCANCHRERTHGTRQISEAA